MVLKLNAKFVVQDIIYLMIIVVEMVTGLITVLVFPMPQSYQLWDVKSSLMDLFVQMKVA